jgi:hypothetical protein
MEQKGVNEIDFKYYLKLSFVMYQVLFVLYNSNQLNSVASAFPIACCGVSERISNDIIP